MLVTELGIVIDVSPLQTANAPEPMLVTELGIVTDDSPVQLENAELPMLVTELGIVNAPVRPLQPENAFAGILVTFSPIFKFINDVQSFHEAPLLVQFVALKFTVVSLLQPENARPLMLVTELGIVIVVAVEIHPVKINLRESA